MKKTTGHWEVRKLEVLGNTPCKWFSRLVWTPVLEKEALEFPLKKRRFVQGVSLRSALRKEKEKADMQSVEDIAEKIGIEQLEKLAKFDGDFKQALDLVRAYRKLAACSLQKSRE